MYEKEDSFIQHKRVNPAVFYIFPLVVLCLFSCSRSNVPGSLEKENVFNIKYGNFEDEINVFDLGEVGEINTSIAMRDGFFYIANGESHKIMEMNSYGDLLNLYYNEEYNPKPSFANNEEVANTTRKAIAYPFNEISGVAVDSRKYLYVVDKLPSERQEIDKKKQLVLSQVILRFDSDGTANGYLGQEGPGGTPFPYINSIYTTDNNELVVICTTAAGHVAYWFSVDGYLLYKIDIDPKKIPSPYSDEQLQSWGNIGSVIPDYNERKLYIKVDYFTGYVDEASHVQSGIDYDQTLLYTLNIEDGRYGRSIVVPPYSEQIAEGFSSERYEIPYDFIGVSSDGWMFFSISTSTGFVVEMVQTDGQKILTRRLDVDRSKVLYSTFNLSNTGILSVLLIQKDQAVLNWWRTDSLIQSVIKN